MKQNLSLFLLFLAFFSPSQNLVHNGSFEITGDCANGFGNLHLAEGWENPNGGTADLYSDCRGKKWNVTGIPENQFGNQEAFDGGCYAGIMCQTYGTNRKEYLCQQLKTKLEKHKKYCVKFYYSRADYLKIEAKTLGFLLSNKKIGEKDYNPIYNASASSDINNDAVKWHQFSALYEAKGGEKYFILGSFDDLNNFRTVHGETNPEKGKHFYTNFIAYYYIDDVSIIETSARYLRQRAGNSG